MDRASSWTQESRDAHAATSPQQERDALGWAVPALVRAPQGRSLAPRPHRGASRLEAQAVVERGRVLIGYAFDAGPMTGPHSPHSRSQTPLTGPESRPVPVGVRVERTRDRETRRCGMSRYGNQLRKG